MATYRPLRSCRLSDDLYLKVKHIADADNRSFNNWLENVLQKIVADYETENGPIEVDSDNLYQ